MNGGTMVKLTMKRFLATLLALSIASVAFADERDTYLELLGKGKYEALEAHLRQWTGKEPENPELCIAWFNYYLQRNSKSGAAIGMDIDRSKPHMVITDPETGEVVGYLGERTLYDHEDVEAAIGWLEKGIALAPDRLDMHFGLIHILADIGSVERQVEAMVRAIDTGARIGSRWLWSLDEKIPDAETIFLESMQDYYRGLYERGTDETLGALRDVSLRQIEAFPRSPHAYNLLSLYYQEVGDYEGSVGILLRALELDRRDWVIVGNLALAYENLGELEKARECLDLIIADGPEEYAEWATYQKERIEE